MTRDEIADLQERNQRRRDEIAADIEARRQRQLAGIAPFFDAPPQPGPALVRKAIEPTQQPTPLEALADEIAEVTGGMARDLASLRDEIATLTDIVAALKVDAQIMHAGNVMKFNEIRKRRNAA